MSEGIRAPGLQQKLDALEADQKRLSGLSRKPAPDPVRLHPNLAALYRRQVEQLHAALTHPSTRDEAFAILRQLIERVAVHPREDGIEIELEGAIVAMVEVALGSDAAHATNAKAALRRLHLDDCETAPKIDPSPAHGSTSSDRRIRNLAEITIGADHDLTRTTLC
jgi:hypothetical protein